MLIEYNESLEKLTGELLCLIPGSQTESMRKTMQAYTVNPNWQLYLWKCGNEFIGLIGIELQKVTFTVQHISVAPAFRNAGIGHAMVKEVQVLQDPRAMRATQGTMHFLSRCWKTAHFV